MIMEEVKRIAVFLILSRVILYFVPKGNYEKYGRFVVSLVLVYLVFGIIKGVFSYGGI